MPGIRITADLIPEEEGGFTVYCPELDIYTQGETEEECLENLREAAALHLEELGFKGTEIKIRKEEDKVILEPLDQMEWPDGFWDIFGSDPDFDVSEKKAS